MNRSSIPKKILFHRVLFCLPLVGVCATAFLPLAPQIRHGLIGVLLVWFQVGLLSGLVS